MRYLVVETVLVDVDNGPAGPYGAASEEETEVSAVTPCDDTRAVCKAIVAVRERGWRHNWAVFEMVDGRSQRRAVTFKMDGRAPYDVEVS